MMTRFRILAAGAALLATTLTLAAQNTQRLSATKANEYGVAYTLPTTALEVTIEAEITEKTPGEFYKYATKYLNVTDPIAKSSVTATVKSVTLTTKGVANPEQRYLVTLKGGQSPYIILGEGGIPLSLNTEKTYSKPAVKLPEAVAAGPTPLETEAARQAVTQEMLQSHSSAKRAELAAEYIYALRQSRADLITGQADQMPPDGAAMQIVLDNLNAQEEALTAMFVGTVSVSTEVRTFTVIPDGDITDSVVARLSAVDGLVDANDLTGTPIYLSLKVLDRGQLPVNEKGEKLPFPKNGVAYTIPGTAAVTVTYNNKVMADSRFEFAQFGEIYGMNPSNFTDKKAPVYLLFDPATGAAAEVGPASVN